MILTSAALAIFIVAYALIGMLTVLLMTRRRIVMPIAAVLARFAER